MNVRTWWGRGPGGSTGRPRRWTQPSSSPRAPGPATRLPGPGHRSAAAPGRSPRSTRGRGPAPGRRWPRRHAAGGRTAGPALCGGEHAVTHARPLRSSPGYGSSYTHPAGKKLTRANILLHTRRATHCRMRPVRGSGSGCQRRKKETERAATEAAGAERGRAQVKVDAGQESVRQAEGCSYLSVRGHSAHRSCVSITRS